MIRQTSIVEAQAAFDPAAFLDSRWDDQNDPVGNTLTTGGAPRYLNNQYSGAAGMRQQTQTGGKVEVAERVGFQNTNSTFFVPNPQGTSKLVLNYTQPLMRGRGREYNQSLTVLASIDKYVAEEEFSRQLQSHLLEVSRSYWGLYLERALLAQKRQSLERVGSVLTGASGRYKNNQFTTAAGLKRRTQVGGLVEASQQIGIQDTNSAFFQPNPQGTSRLKLSYTHPLLRGNGVLYNVSLSCLAMVDTSIAEAEFSRQMQTHLTEVA